MGQCSTLPAEARQNATSSPGGNHPQGVNYHHSQERDDYATGRARHGYSPQKNQNNNNGTAMTESFENDSTPLTGSGRYSTRKTIKNNNNNTSMHVKVPAKAASPGTAAGSRRSVVHFADSQHQKAPAHMPPVYPGTSNRYVPVNSPPAGHQHASPTQQDPVPMEEDRSPMFPSPPDSAVRTRCYKLNLDSNYVGLSGGGDSRVMEGHLLGPFDEAPPMLTRTISEDSSVVADPTAVAVRTAQIFRGITISSDGTILSQNARATRANRNKNKRGEKSRQAAKIDKAKDLVEESIITGKAPNSNDPANMVSLVIIGEYDNMSHLVRDGAKKLRDNNGVPDEELLAANLQRPSGGGTFNHPRSSTKSPSKFGSSTILSPTRKRVSPHTFSQPSPKPSRYSSSSNLPQSAPPKLKGHPRDRPSTRRLNNNDGGSGGFRRFPVHDACNGMFSPQHSGGNDSDWSEALGFSKGLNSFFYCGGADQTVTQPSKDKAGHVLTSPNNIRSPQGQQQPNPAHEYRNDSPRYGRAYNSGGRTPEPNSPRVDAPGREKSIGKATVQV